ncbi:MAG: hypothetical protein EKK30_13665 [Hyphomicrobium sp.]|nr:MAG: hypothetical protein EKK30_13665 [Hyphomicrobium sp.]
MAVVLARRTFRSLPFALGAIVLACPAMADDGPSLIGTWTGKTNTIGDVHGLRTRDRTVHITEQTDRRFRGYFVYEDGRKDFFGIVFPDNVSFGWVSPASKGQVQGRILSADHIAACYLESGEQATAGCSDLMRTSAKP